QRALREGEAMVAAGEDALQTASARLDQARSRLRLLSPSAQVEQGYLRLDDLGNRLFSALRGSVQLQRQRLAEARALLAQRSPERRVQTESHRLLALWKRLQSASPASVLNRGFVIMRDAEGRALSRKSGASAGQTLSAEFADGVLPVRVEDTGP
ncbi:MAG TPA: exodeoxyribonuclease VII large subunit, partial [Opitutus sp.]|nr:exodeoxyribonuclease VII large subunit [Opitutus sp.]